MRKSIKSLKPDLFSPIEAELILRNIEPGLELETSSELYGGAISRVYDLKLVGTAPNLILKVYPEASHWKLSKEVSVYRLLSAFPSLPVPRVVWFDDSKTILPVNLLVMTKINGQIHPIESSLSDEQLFDLYAQMGQILRRFHDVSMDSFGYIVGEGIKEPHATNKDYMLFQFNHKLKEFRDLGGETQLAARIERHVELCAGLLEGRTAPAFCHDDYHTGNIIVELGPTRKFQLTGVVDVENAVAGDPLIDLAKTLLYCVRGSQVKCEGLLAGYGPIDRRNWEQTVDLYRLYHALEFWDWVAQLGAERPSWLCDEMKRVVAS